MRARQAARLLRSFGDGTRLRILFLLSRQHLSVGQLAKALRVPVKRVSRHLQYLAARDLVQSETRKGRTIYWVRNEGGPLHGVMMATLEGCRHVIEERRADQRRSAEAEERGK